MSKKTITDNGKKHNHVVPSGKPMASPAKVVTGAGPKGSGNWKSMYSGKNKGC